MTNSRYRCAGCREYFTGPPFSSNGVQRFHSAECINGRSDRETAGRKPMKRTAFKRPDPDVTRKRRGARRRPPKDEVPTAVREAVMVRDNRQCAMCGTSRLLHVHHIRYRSEGVDHQAHNLIVLCGGMANGCHDRVHSDKRRWKRVLLAYVWLRMVERRQLSVPQVEKLILKIEG